MKNSSLNKFLAICLSVILIVLAIPVGMSFADAGNAPVKNIDYFVGETVLDDDFKDMALGNLNDVNGWMAGAYAPDAWLTWPWTFYNDVVEQNGDKAIDFGVYNGDSWLLTNKLSVENYIYETEIIVVDDAGSLGIVTQGFGDGPNVTPPVIGVTYLTTYGQSAAVGATEKSTFDVKGKGVVAATANDLPLPEGAPYLAKGNTLNFKVISLEGHNYYYVNDLYIGSVVIGVTNADYGYERVGLYACNGRYTVNSMKVTKIYTSASEVPFVPVENTDYFVGTTILDNDFQTMTQGTVHGQSDWVAGAWLPGAWLGSNYTFYNDVTADKTVDFGVYNANNWLLTNKLSIENYIYEVELEVVDDGGVLGIVTQSFGDPGSMTDATRFTIYGQGAAVGGTEKSTFVVSGHNSSASFVYPNGVEYPSNGVTLKFKVICLNGYNCYYVNDSFIGSVALGVSNATYGYERVGLYALNGRYTVNSMKVTNVYTSPVEIPFVPVEDTDYFVGDSVLNEDFQNMNVGTVHGQNDWVAGAWLPGAWLGGGYVFYNDVTSDKTIDFGVYNADNWLLTNKLPVKNYIYETEFTVIDDGGSVGIVTQSFGDPGSMTGGTQLVIYGQDALVGATEKSTFDVKGYGSVAATAEDIPLPEGVSYLKEGVTFKFTVICLEGHNYYFVNDKYIGSVQLSLTNENYGYERVGLYSCNARYTVNSIKVANIYTSPDDIPGDTSISVDSLSLGYADLLGNSEDWGAASLSFDMSLDKFDKIYTDNIIGNYSANGEIEVGFVAYFAGDAAEYKPTISTDGAIEFIFDKFTQDDAKVYFEFKLVGLGFRVDKYINIRPFVKIGDNYRYASTVIFCAANEANKLYGAVDTTEEIKGRLDKVFAQSEVFLGSNAKTITFTAFSDFHYQEGLYMSSLADMNAILDRAKAADSSFVLSSGDFCNDFIGSPELTNLWINNSQGLTVYNIYGNHELESSGNSMAYVTSKLTNDAGVVWGTADGKIGDGSIGYYYVDRDGFRIVNTDTNYSYNAIAGDWQHNLANSYGAPNGNTEENSLGSVQLAWLEKVLTDAAYKGIPCIVNSHDSFAGQFGSTSPDAVAVRNIYAKVNAIRKGTVLMSINGHMHTNHQAIVDGVFYLDLNTVRNAAWYPQASDHYADEHVFEKITYDTDGNVISIDKNSKLADLGMGHATWFSADPLCAVITVDQFGNVKIDGIESNWIYGIDPNTHHDANTTLTTKDGEEPRIASGEWKLDF